MSARMSRMSVHREQHLNLLQDRPMSMISAISADPERPIRLHEWLTNQQIEEIHLLYQDRPDARMTFEELRNVLFGFNIIFTDKEYQTLFYKIAVRDSGYCTWDEFVSFLLFGFQEDDPNNQKEDIVLAISEPPTLKKTDFRQPINSIALVSNISSTDTDDYSMYITTTKDGSLKFWSATELEPARTFKSKSPYLKFTATWVLNVEVMSDIRIAVISTTERELRFYDITATNFNLRMIVTSVPYAVCAMSYTFTNMKNTSKLVLGDLGGNVRMFIFHPLLRGPFQSKAGTALVSLTWQELVRGAIAKVTIKEFFNVHRDLVTQVYFSHRYNFIISSAECYSSLDSLAVVITPFREGTPLLFTIPKGVNSFYMDDQSRILATGGPDTCLRIWDPLFPQKSTATLYGHNAGIIYVFIQAEENKIYSVDISKVIKVWHLLDYTLLQTYQELKHILIHEHQFICFYNKNNHDLLICGRKLVRIRCCPKLNMDLTDGNTHSGPVSIVLYNKLFQNIVTCGLDSYIIIWDPWNGKRQGLIKNAHTVNFLGEIVTVEITAACFNPQGQLLITGARNGTLKIWFYNNAICIRNLTIETNCEVTKIFWLPERILAVGWNRHVAEFPDIKGEEYNDEKPWPSLHFDDITCGAAIPGQAVVTGDYSGHLLFWKSETGQPYKKFNVDNPTQFIRVSYHNNTERKVENKKFEPKRFTRHSISKVFRSDARAKRSAQKPRKESRINARLLSNTESNEMLDIPNSVQALLFLQTRPMNKDYGTLLAALDNGKIQVYSHHEHGGYITEFNAIHKTNDCVVAMATDENNKYLFAGTATGYIKIFLMKNFCVPEVAKQHTSLPKLRLQFMFLRKERFPGRAKRMAEKTPMLVNCFRGHLKSVSSIIYIDSSKIIVTGSYDCSCRLWSLGGRYIGTLGSPNSLLKIQPWMPMKEEGDFRLPPDIKRVASSTTLKVISGEYYDMFKEMKEQQKLLESKKSDEIIIAEENKCGYGKPLKEPILGHHFKLPTTTPYHPLPVLDKSLPYIPVYAHLTVHDAQLLEELPPTPRQLKETKNMEFMDYYNPKGK